MRIVSKRFNEWPPAVRRQLIRATLPDGSMRFCVRKKPDTRTLVAFEDGCVLGWLLFWPTKVGTFATAYVFKKYRGKKIAPKLYARALAVESPLQALAWDEASWKLFTAVRDAHPGKLEIHDWLPFRSKYGQLQEIGIDE